MSRTVSWAIGLFAMLCLMNSDVAPAWGAPLVLDEDAAVLGGLGASWGGNTSEGYNQDTRYSSSATATATWTFTGLADGEYDVLASWFPHVNRSTEIDYTIGTNPAVRVSQEPLGTGLYLQGDPVNNDHLFHYLGDPVTVSGGSLSVVATNNRSGTSDYMIADAVAVRPSEPRTYIMDNTSGGFATDFPNSLPEGFYAGVRYTPPNSAGAGQSATWSFTDLADGTYKVYATWSTNGNRTKVAPFSVHDSTSQIGSTALVNQEVNPYASSRSDLQNVDTANWHGLGSYSTSDGTLTVRLDGLNNTSGTDYVIADAIRIEQIAPSREQTWIGVFHAGDTGNSDPWSFTDPITNTVANAENPSFGDGILGDQPVAGDWDGDGTDGVAVFRSDSGNGWYFTNDRTSPTTDISGVAWGSGTLGDIAVAGDWNGDGIDGVAVFRASATGTSDNWFLADDPTAIKTDHSFHHGSGSLGDLPVAGDWDGDGTDGVGIFRSSTNTWYLSDGLTDSTDYSIVSGFFQAGDIPVAEDWDLDGFDDVGLFRPSTGEWFFDTNFDGFYDIYNPGFGLAGDMPLVGHFAVPEPGTFGLVVLGLVGAGLFLRRRRS